MKRLELYKKTLENMYEETGRKESVGLLFQELMNQLTTYDEKRAFAHFHDELEKKVASR